MTDLQRGRKQAWSKLFGVKGLDKNLHFMQKTQYHANFLWGAWTHNGPALTPSAIWCHCAQCREVHRLCTCGMRAYSLHESVRQRKHTESSVVGCTGKQHRALMGPKRCRGVAAGGMTMCMPDGACNSCTVRHAGCMQIQVFDMLVFKPFGTLHTLGIRAQSTQPAPYARTVAPRHACSMHLSSVLLSACMHCVTQKESDTS